MTSSAPTILAVCAIVALAGGVQAVTGFGFALVAVPLLALLIGPQPAVVVAIMIGLVLASGVGFGERRHIARRDVLALSAVSLIGLPLGLWVLTRWDERALTALVAVVLVCSTALIWRGATVPTGPVARVLAGFSSGTLLVSTSFNGPPLVIFLAGKDLAPRSVRATLAACFFVQEVVAVALLAVAGLIDQQALLLSAVGLPALAVGWRLGDRAFVHLDRRLFRRSVLIMLALTGVVAFVRVAWPGSTA